MDGRSWSGATGGSAVSMGLKYVICRHRKQPSERRTNWWRVRPYGVTEAGQMDVIVAQSLFSVSFNSDNIELLQSRSSIWLIPACEVPALILAL